MNLLLTVWLGMATSVPGAWPAFLGAGAELSGPGALPLRWSPTENIAWLQSLPGHGQSSPVVWADRVFVTSVEGPQKETFHTVCFDVTGGRELWRRSIANSTPVTNSYYVSRAAPTPVVDKNVVIAQFESGDCVAYDHAGNELWTRALSETEGPLLAEFGLAASPCQTESHVFVLLEHDGPSCLLALDKGTGETTWKAPRQPRRSWSSPTVMQIDGVTQVVVSSAGAVDGYDAQTGTLLWTFSDVGGNTATTPITTGDGRFLIGAAPTRDGKNSGSVADSNCLLEVHRQGGVWMVRRQWIAQGAIPSWASPIIHEGLAYWINRAGVIYCFDAESGEKVYAERTEQSCWATPYGAGDRIYLFGKDGLVTVIAAGREFKVLAENASWNAETLPAEPPLEQDTSEERRQAAAMFSKPTLYGVAVSSPALLLRVGNGLICVRDQAAN